MKDSLIFLLSILSFAYGAFVPQLLGKTFKQRLLIMAFGLFLFGGIAYLC